MAGPKLELVPAGTGDARVPPNDQAAEMSTLGGMLLSKDAAAVVLEMLTVDDFYYPKHSIIFAAINTVFGRSEPIDVIMITEQLTREGNLAKVGGASYLHTLESSVPTAANASYYAGIVADKSVLRKLVESGTRITQMGYAAEGEPSELVNEAQMDIFAIGRASGAQDALVLFDAVNIAVDEMEKQAKQAKEGIDVPTGFRELDDVTNGLQPGQLVLIAARPGLGKSTLALDIARASALRANVPTVFFSLEMSASEISQRLLAAETSVPLSVIRKAKELSGEGWKRIASVQARIGETPLYIDDSPNLTLSEIRAKCRRLKAQRGIKLVIIDYLQLLTSGKKVENRQQEVSEFSRSLKLLAKELDVPIVALSQLNRGPEQSQDKRPLLSHLRESGSLEQDADIVLLLHRDRQVEQGQNTNDAEILIAKHRNGEMRDVKVLFEGHYSRFSDIGPV
jgi:replicative DNA helicase